MALDIILKNGSSFNITLYEETGFTGAVSQFQEAQTQTASGVYLIDGVSAQEQEAQNQDIEGLYFVDGIANHSQSQTSDATGDNNSIFVPEVSSGIHVYYMPVKKPETENYIWGISETIQEPCVQHAVGVYGLIAKGATRQSSCFNKAAGVYKCIGFGDSITNNISKAKGGVVTAEDEMLIIMRLLEVA